MQSKQLKSQVKLGGLPGQPRGKQHGVAVIEAVIAMPVVLFVVFALIQYTLTFGALIIMNNTVSEAARFTTVYRSNANSADYTEIANAALLENLPSFTDSFRENVQGEVEAFDCGDTRCLRLSLVYPNYSESPLVPNFFMVPLPEELRAESVTKVELSAPD